jgi:hypothetical protein
MVFSIYITAASVAIAFMAGSYFGYDYADSKCEADKRQALQSAVEQRDQQQDKYNRMAGWYEKRLANVRKQERVVTKVVEKEIEKPVYSQCIIPDSGVQLLNDSASSFNSSRSSSKPDG